MESEKLKNTVNDETKYYSFVKDNCEIIGEKVNMVFGEKKEEIRDKFIEMLSQVLTEKDIVHYNWSPESEYGEYWDHSGSLQEDGEIDLTQTVEDFLNDEYTGNWYPTYESGRGKMYLTYNDYFSHETLDIGAKIMTDVVTEELQNKFPELTLEKCEDIIFETHDYVYDNCLAHDFFDAVVAFEYAGLNDKTLEEILENQYQA